jgi:hypothetical protein
MVALHLPHVIYVNEEITRFRVEGGATPIGAADVTGEIYPNMVV